MKTERTSSNQKQMRVVKGRLFSQDEDISELFGPEGYDREPLTEKLGIKDELSMQMFGNPEPTHCLLGFDQDLDKPIACSLAAPLEEWLAEFADKMEILDESTLESEDWRSFVSFYRQVLEDECEFLELCEDVRLAIRCGLIVHSSCGRRGYGTELIKQSDAHLKELGYEYVLVHASSPYSQSIFRKQGYIPVHTYDLKEWFKFEGTVMNMLKLL